MTTRARPKQTGIPELSVVIPAYNEGESLPVLLPRVVQVLRQLKQSYEVIVVNDGSSDDTDKVLAMLKRKHRRLRAITLDGNYGQSSAFDAGFQSARGKTIITMDADLQNAPEDIPRLLELMPEYDMVCGWRTERRDTLVKRVSSRIANFVRSRATGDRIHDTGCSLKAFKRSCLEGLPRFSGMHRFFPALFKQAGYKVVEVPVSHYPRKLGKTKYGLLNRLVRPTTDLLGVIWLGKRRLRYKIKNSS